MLYQEYRPKTLSEFQGNKGLKASLESILKEEKIPHSFLFHGPSGCGKTTLAYIIATKLTCSSMDLHEINAANNRGIETARELIKTLDLQPMMGDTKVILLDEVHATTKDFQNALLKSLEDTPSHVYFILCTTNPEKLLKTVRNRCTTFEVKALGEDDLYSVITDVLTQENIEEEFFPDDAIEAIIKASEGCPRQALVMVEQIKGLNPKQMKESVEKFASYESSIIDLCRAMTKRQNWKGISTILQGLDAEPETIRRSILGYFNKVLLSSGSPVHASIMDVFSKHTYDSGRAGLTLMCFMSTFIDKK